MEISSDRVEKKTDTPAVCPGRVMKEPNVPAARMIHP